MSSLVVVDGLGRLAGVISRTDLLRVGRLRASMAEDRRLLTLPHEQVAKRMSHPAETVPPDLPVRKVARVMIAHNIHRVVIADEDRPIGILSVTDLLRAVADERVVTPVQHAMRAPVVTVDASAPLHEAADLLAAAHVHGLVVVEATWPVGVFTQREALEARELPRDTPVEAAMSCAMLCLPPDTPLHRAAAFLAGTRARRLLVVEGRRLKGTATAVDLVGVIATA